MGLFLDKLAAIPPIGKMMSIPRDPARAPSRSPVKPRSASKSRRNAAPEAAPQAALTRRQVLIDEAARLFSLNGYDSTSMRDIAAAMGILPGSLYHHFESKEEMFIEVYSLGVSQILNAVTKAIARHDDPWARLEAACEAHLQALLVKDSYAAVVISHLSFNTLPKQDRLVRLRDKYESIFKSLVEDLPLRPGTDRRMLRLGLLGAMNWAIVWYRQGGEAPSQIARKLLAFFRTN